MASSYTLTSKDVIKKASISIRQLYYWEMKGIVKPELVDIGSRKFKRYSDNDVNLLKKIKLFLADGYTLDAAVKKINQWGV